MYVHYNYAVCLVCCLFGIYAQNCTVKQHTAAASPPNKVRRKETTLSAHCMAVACSELNCQWTDAIPRRLLYTCFIGLPLRVMRSLMRYIFI